MATSKTLTPTNVTISIPEMTDSPNASVFSNCVDKEADAINTLNTNIANIEIVTVDASLSAGTSKSYASSEFTRGIITVSGGTTARNGIWFIYNAGNGFVIPLFDPSAFGSQISCTSDGNSLTITNNSNGTVKIRGIKFTNAT